VLLSLVAPPAARSAAFLTAWAAVAAAQMLRRQFDVGVAIKWPNDLLVGEKKIGGVLVEVRRAQVVGVGLNLNQTAEDFPPDARLPPTSLFLEQNVEADRAEVAGALLQRMDELYDESLERGQAVLFESWAILAETFESELVRAVARRTEVVGRVVSVRPDCGAVIERLGGGHSTIPAEELLRIERVGKQTG
jgi:BirA family biotin operon repressor/biotin-[acetyl-CoA-carboxylase] ligase